MRIPNYKVSLVRDGSVEADVCDSPSKAAVIAREMIGDADREHLIVLLINARNKIVGVNTVSIGTLTASLVHPREVFKPAILAGAAAIVIAHNHPSGDCTPSPEDRDCTRRLREAGTLLGIPLIDSIIVTQDKHFSFQEGGLL